MLFAQLRCSELFPSLLETVGTLLESKFPHASYGATLQSELSEDSSLRPAVLTLESPQFANGHGISCIKENLML